MVDDEIYFGHQFTDAEAWDRCESFSAFSEFLWDRHPNCPRIDRKARLFCVAILNPHRHLLEDNRSHDALDAAERYADSGDPEGMAEIAEHAEYVANATDGSPAWDLADAAWKVAIPEPIHDGGFSVWSDLQSTIEDLGLDKDYKAALAAHLIMFRDIFPYPFRPVAFDPAWRTEVTTGLAQAMYDAREFGNLPVLADAIQEAGCELPAVLDHCRGAGPHVRGCWVVDLVLGKA